MVTISINAAAFAAIEATLPKGSRAEARPDRKGGYLVTLDRNVLDRLRAKFAARARAQRRDHPRCEGLSAFGSSLRAAGERLAKRPRDRCTVGFLGHLRMVSQELLEGAHDLAPFEIGRSAIGSLSRGVRAPGNPLAKALAITSATILIPRRDRSDAAGVAQLRAVRG